MEYRKNLRYEILTPSGFKTFRGIRKIEKPFYYRIGFLETDRQVGASEHHKFWIEEGQWKEVCKLIPGDRVVGIEQNYTVETVRKVCERVTLFDAIEVDGGHRYYTDSLLSSNCDCNFLASGDTVLEPEDMSFYEETYQTDPVERRGLDGNLWIWEYPDYSKSYMISADVARGDGSDYSAFHVWDIENCTQIAEYKGKLSPRDYGAVLCGVASEYNNALLVCENANVGWSTIEEIIHRGYPNLYYGDNSTQDTAESYASKLDHGKLTPGFTTSPKTRPLIIAKLVDYIHQKSVIIRSKRTLLELRTFIWKNGKAQAADKYHDDLVMSCGIGLYVRDTALRLRQQGLDLSRAQMGAFSNMNRREDTSVVKTTYAPNPYQVQDMHGHTQDISWVLR